MNTLVAVFCVGGWCLTWIFVSTTFTVKVYVPLSCLLGLPEFAPTRLQVEALRQLA